MPRKSKFDEFDGDLKECIKGVDKKLKDYETDAKAKRSSAVQEESAKEAKDENISVIDLKSLWNAISLDAKQKYDINLGKWAGQIALILVVLLAVLTVLSWSIGSNVETKGDIQADSGNYGAKGDNVNTSGNEVRMNGNTASGTDIKSSAYQATYTDDMTEVFNGAFGAAGPTMSALVVLVVTGLALTFTMGVLFKFLRILL